MAWSHRQDWGPVQSSDGPYDLVVVGAGISGLSAAYIYQKKFGAEKRILILDNHDDFGGHARRNEFALNSQTRMSYGGSQYMKAPWEYSSLIRRLLDDLKINLDRLEEAYDINWFKSNGLHDVTFLTKNAMD